MADRETELERLCDAVKAREDALLAALDALVAEYDEKYSRPDYLSAGDLRRRLVVILREHRAR